MTISTPPAAPSTSDPASFATKADALLAWLGTGVSEINAAVVAMNLNSTTDTSTSSVAIGTGSKSFTVSTGKSFQPGMYLVLADAAAPSTNSIFAQITSYNTGSGALVVESLAVRGSGTKTSWVVSQSSAGGAASGTNGDITSLTAMSASTAEVKAGINSTKLIAADKLLAALGYSATHLSGAITVAQAGGNFYAHGLTREPIDIQVSLTCISADGNFSAGKRVVVPSNYGSGVSFHGMTITFDATNVYYKFVNAASVYVVPDPATGNAFTLDNTKWQAYIRVWA